MPPWYMETGMVRLARAGIRFSKGKHLKVAPINIALINNCNSIQHVYFSIQEK